MFVSSDKHLVDDSEMAYRGTTMNVTLLRWFWCLLALGAPLAYAHLLASDSFSSGGTTQVGLGGGIGWDTAAGTSTWISNASTNAAFVPSPSSLSPTALATSGGSVTYDGNTTSSNSGARIYRLLDVGPGSVANGLGLTNSHTTFFGDQQYGYGKTGTTLWLGFLLNGGTAGNGLPGSQYEAQMHLYDGMDQSNMTANDNNKDAEVIAIGRGAGNYVWNFERTCNHSPCGGNNNSVNALSTVTMNGQTHWVVLKFDFISTSSAFGPNGGTSITFWLDPTPGAISPDPATALTLTGNSQSNVQTIAMPALQFNWIEFGGEQAVFGMDEIRVADTFADLSSCPGCVVNDEIFYDGFGP
jgi:hypothetical protein